MGESSSTNSYLVRFSGETEAFSAGQAIFREGDHGDAMYVVKEGEVSIVVHDKVIETVGPGEVVGEMALIDKRPRSATAMAKTDCRVVRIDEQRFTFLVQQTPYFALEVMRAMASRLRRMDARA